tara:strand:- start:1294 stop:2040 length:747 start_codon:yes stop_codon:yes gene_type:complete
MATFEDKIISLTGITSNTQNQTYIDAWLEMACKDVLIMLPKEALLDISGSYTLDDTNNKMHNVDDFIVLHVMRRYTNKDTEATTSALVNTRYRDCRQVSHRSISLAEEDSGYLEACSVEDPIYYIFQNNLYVLPQCTDEYTGIVSRVVFPKATSTEPLYSKEALDNFPNELEQAVVYRAAANAARFLFQDEQDDEIYIPMIKDLTNQFANSIKLYLSKFKKAAPLEEEDVSRSGSFMKALTKAMGGAQ